MSILKNLDSHKMAADSETSEYGCRRSALIFSRELVILSILMPTSCLRMSGQAHPTQTVDIQLAWQGKLDMETTFTKHAGRVGR